MEEIKTPTLKNRENEKGAAMVMVLLISFLLLIASAGILLEATMNTANISDATADQQAYNAAESGIQSALNVLRGNVKPSPLLDAAKPNTDSANLIDFRKALKNSTSNLSSDAASEPARLSRWGMTYAPDRVKIGDTTKGYAYKISLTDPDNTNSSLTYTTVSPSSGIYDAASATYSLSRTFGSGTSSVKITYNPVSTTVLNVSSGAGTADLGNFQVELGGASGTIPNDVRFQIVLTATSPYEGNRALYGVIKAGTFFSNAVSTVKYDFYSPAYELLGSVITLAAKTTVPGPVSANGGKTSFSGSMTQIEPRRILISSTGFGPRGARKQLEAIVKKDYFDGLTAPAALTMIGSSNGFSFSPGNSDKVTYSGDDIESTINIPSIGVTNTTNLTSVINNPPKTALNPPPTDVSIEVPDWLSSPAKLDATIRQLYDIAVKSNRVFGANGLTPPDLGDVVKGQGITFIDGDSDFSGAGGGILVCTGKLTLNGGVDFKGLIIITGEGGFERTGGGSGTLQGNTVIAPYAKSRILGRTTADQNSIATAPFLGPKYKISGGGSSELVYNSSSVDNGLKGVNNIVLGIAEK